ncbi:MAG TPA: zf-HC2 domain-containing protein [Pyrinomonadaceae bacterium]
MKETWDKRMPEETNICARAEDVVAYLYGEATTAEARDFERHMERCSACRTEMATFGDVREAIGEWRELSLGAITSPVSEVNAAYSPLKAVGQQKRSALAALREFFSLSPLWMRAATVAAAIVFAVLTFIAVAYFKNQPKVLVVETPNHAETVVKDNDDTQVAGNDAPQEDQRVKDQPAPQQEAVAVDKAPQAPGPTKRRVHISTQQQAKNRKVAPRILNQQPEEVADYLPFTASSPEAKLPTLADLADEFN